MALHMRGTEGARGPAVLERRWCRFGTSNGAVCVTVDQRLRLSQPITHTAPLSGTNVSQRLHVGDDLDRGIVWEGDTGTVQSERDLLRQLE